MKNEKQTAGQTANETQLSTNLKRALALKQMDGDSFFILEGRAFEGTLEEANEGISGFEDGEEKPDLLTWCEDNLTEIEELNPGDYNNDYLVLTDEEADEKWEESLDSYIEECITPEIDKLDVGNLSYYIKFDEELWKRDAKMDGRGHSLATYDGNEYEETIQGETFYIYRLN